MCSLLHIACFEFVLPEGQRTAILSNLLTFLPFYRVLSGGGGFIMRRNVGLGWQRTCI